MCFNIYIGNRAQQTTDWTQTIQSQTCNVDRSDTAPNRDPSKIVKKKKQEFFAEKSTRSTCDFLWKAFLKIKGTEKPPLVTN